VRSAQALPHHNRQMYEQGCVMTGECINNAAKCGYFSRLSPSSLRLFFFHCPCFVAGVIIVLSSMLFAEEAEYDCPYCSDTGKVACPACKAGEAFWCSECARQINCDTCGGLGWILCPKCGGDDAKAERDFLLEKRKQHEKISRIVGTQLRCIETPRFRFFTDIDHRKSHAYARILEAYADRYNATFGSDPGEKVWQGKCDVYLFQPREAFVKFAAVVDGKPEVAASGGYSCPSPAAPLVVLFKESRSDDDTIRTIIHELAHVHLDLYHNHSPIPRWVHEGVAQLFEFSYKPETSRRKESLQRVKKALDEGTLMPLRELSEMKFGHAESLPYAAAWAAVDFLMTTDKEAFVRWINLMKDGEDQHAAFQSAFGTSLSSANRAWTRHVKGQK